MASVARKGAVFFVRFRFQGQQYKRSLKVRNQSDADCAKAIVEQTLYRIRITWGTYLLLPGLLMGLLIHIVLFSNPRATPPWSPNVLLIFLVSIPFLIPGAFLIGAGAKIKLA
jgi:hypothetical protein